MKTLRFRTTHETHPGLRRRENEDAVAIHPGAPLWAVADGMGGHLHGRFASDAVVRNLVALPIGHDLEVDVGEIKRGITAANWTVFERARTEGATIGTTVAAFYAHGAQGVCFWVGDSRVYRYRDEALEQLTRDHTQVRHLLETNEITPEQAVNHPMGHVLTRAVGVDPKVRIETLTIDLAPEDTILICSDGLTACAELNDIADALRELGSSRACQRLIDLCLERGAPDNVSIVTIACDEVTAVEDTFAPA
jgi:serine/threonine protein phosphatase PrpC